MRITMRLHSIFASLLLTCIASFIASAQTVRAPPYLDESPPIKKRVDDMVSRMTLEEKISQMTNDSAAIPRLNIPGYNWWNEGLNGVARSGYATLFPQVIGMAATWDTDLIGREATVISAKGRAKYNQAVGRDIRAGWNRFLIKLTRTNDRWTFASNFMSSQAGLLLQIDSSLEMP
jgi:beta-glucosidase